MSPGLQKTSQADTHSGPIRPSIFRSSHPPTPVQSVPRPCVHSLRAHLSCQVAHAPPRYRLFNNHQRAEAAAARSSIVAPAQRSQAVAARPLQKRRLMACRSTASSHCSLNSLPSRATPWPWRMLRTTRSCFTRNKHQYSFVPSNFCRAAQAVGSKSPFLIRIIKRDKPLCLQQRVTSGYELSTAFLLTRCTRTSSEPHLNRRSFKHRASISLQQTAR